jgi:hypothetical protein
MKNNQETDYSFRAFLHELMTKRDVQILAIQTLTFMFAMVFGLAVVIALYNIATGIY